MNGKCTVLAAMFALTGLVINGNTANAEQTLDIGILEEREKLMVDAPSAEAFQEAHDAISFSGDWSIESDLEDRFEHHKVAWRNLVATHERTLARIQKTNHEGAALLAWAGWLELGSQVMTFANVINAASSGGAGLDEHATLEETGATLEICRGNDCEALPIELLLEESAPSGGSEIEVRQFDLIRGGLHRTLSDLRHVRCSMTEGRCWEPGAMGEGAIRHPASFALLGHAARIAGSVWRGSAHYGRYAGATAARHWRQWRNINEHWQKHAQKFPGNPSVMQYAGDMSQFLKNPPKGTRAATRANGDRMFYHAASDRFGVIGKDGFMKTYFRPGRGISKDGRRYWRGQLRQWQAKEWIVK